MMLFAALLSVTGMSQAAVPGEVIAAWNVNINQTAVMSPDGSNQTYPGCLGGGDWDLTHMAIPRHFVGSVSGSNVVYIDSLGNPNYNTELVAVDEDCVQVVVLSNLGNMKMGAAKWSPDGTMIAFIGHEYAIDEPPPVLLPMELRNELYLADVVYTGNRPTGVTNFRMVFEGVWLTGLQGWAPDSGRLVYAAPSGSRDDLYVYTLATGQSVNITNTPDQAEVAPSWGSSGRIAYARLSARTRSGDRYDIFSIPEAGGAEMQITSKSSVTSPRNSMPAHSPDGQYMAFSSCSSSNTINGGDCALYRIRADGSGKAVKIVGGKNQNWTHARWRH
jgi:Tol biopolymer transport system component